MPKKHTVRALADIHTQLASESRLRILKALSGNPASVASLSRLLAITASAVSAQLQKLRMVGLVDFTRDSGITYHLTEPVHPVVAATLALLDGAK